MGLYVVPLLAGYGVFVRLQYFFSIIICMPTAVAIMVWYNYILLCLCRTVNGFWMLINFMWN